MATALSCPPTSACSLHRTGLAWGAQAAFAAPRSASSESLHAELLCVRAGFCQYLVCCEQRQELGLTPGCLSTPAYLSGFQG